MFKLEGFEAQNAGRQRRHGTGGAAVISALAPSPHALALLLSGARALSSSATGLPADEHWSSNDSVLIREPEGVPLGQCLPRGPHRYGDITRVHQRRAQPEVNGKARGELPKPPAPQSVRPRRPSTRQQASHGVRQAALNDHFGARRESDRALELASRAGWEAQRRRCAVL